MRAGRARPWMVVGAAAAAMLLVFLVLLARTPPGRSPEPSARVQDALARAGALAAAGHLREAQDAYLTILLTHGIWDPGAFEGIVRVRSRLAHRDPRLLRRDAKFYADAAARGMDTPEHYTAESMRVLAAASLVAALRAEASQGRTGRVVPDASAQGSSGGAGPLQTEQDQDLRAFAASGGSGDVMRRLVVLRRLMLHDNSELLRREAHTYLQAAGRGEEVEHYTPDALRVLAAADELAAAQVEAERLSARAGRPTAFPVTVVRPPAAGIRAAAEILPARPLRPAPSAAGAQEPPSAAPSSSPPHTPGPVAPQPPGPVAQAPSPPPRPAPVGVSSPTPLPGSGHAVPQGRTRAPGRRPRPREAVPAKTAFRYAVLVRQRSGRIGAVDCLRGSFTLRSPGGSYAYSTTPATVTFAGIRAVRGACALRAFTGSRAVVWSTAMGRARIAGRIAILPASGIGPAPALHPEQNQQNDTPPGR